MTNSGNYVRRFEDLALADVSLVGSRNASLGELYRELSPLGVNVPKGLAVTAHAYRDTLWPTRVCRRNSPT